MRLEFTTRSDLAIRAMQLLSRPEAGRMRRSTMAGELNTTPDFLARVMGPLVKEGWVSSITGPGGGYQLEETGRSASIYELIDAIEGVPPEGQCVLRGGPCDPNQKCALHDPWTRARKAMTSELHAETVLGEGTTK